jgi:hypothetical protein
MQTAAATKMPRKQSTTTEKLSKSTVSLTQLKKTTQNFPLLQHIHLS